MSSDNEKKNKFSDDIKDRSEETVNPGIPIPAAVPIMIFLFAIGLIVGGFFLPLGKRGEKCPKDTNKRTMADKSAKPATGDAGPIKRVNFKIPADAPFYGPKDAPVSIVVFDDFQCPWCKKASEVIGNAMKNHKNDTRFVMINFPLTRIHKEAELAAAAGMEAHAQGKFKEMHDKLFVNPRAINMENVLKWAGEIKMNVETLKAALESNKYKTAIDAQMNQGKMIGVRGTPTILVNGRKFNMQRDLNKAATDLSAMIQEELKIVAQRKMPRGKAYEMLVAGGVRNMAALVDRPNPRDAKNKQPPRKRPPRKILDPNVPYKVEYTGKEPWKGGKEPLVTIIEFSEFQCPYCERVEPTMAKLLEDYKDDLKVVYVQNPLPFHKLALPASVAALEVLAQKGLKGYWDFHKHVFANRKDINPENIEKWVKDVAKLDMAKYKTAVDSKVHENTIKEGQAIAAKFGARGTPAFFINGYFINGARPVEQFKAIIDREMGKVKKAIEEKKTTRADAYKFAMSTALPQAKYIMQETPERPKRKPRPRLDHTKTYKIFPLDNVPFVGDPNAEVVMAIGFDVQCPFCKRIWPMVKELLEGEQPKDGKPAEFKGYKKGVKIVLLHYPLPFHKQAPLAHEAYQEVFAQKGPAALMKYLDKMFENPKDLSRPTLEKIAGEVGVDMNKFKAALDKSVHKKIVDDTMALAKKIGVMGTPAVYINGKFARGRSTALYRKAIDEEMAAAKKLFTEKKIPLAKYYEEIMKTATADAVWIQPEEKPAPGGAPVLRRIGPPNVVAPNAMGPAAMPLKPVVRAPAPAVMK
ncbi:thioredoxin domain-containing protein [Myxococcota bacterium]|nr:thioredoxin domain-containing protein [Myxococcota bacterium]MBU1382844.1 thioredoxin domain-containing protein [Myxococcota bacterium]MBU1498993.1 thioredoxin domain-containing protein [Myxococcota bacterium]